MEIETLIPFAPPALAGLAALALGFALGARRSRRSRRELQRALGAQSIELLDARAECGRLRAQLERQPRQGRVLRLALVRLREARQRETRAAEAMRAAERAAFVRESQLRLAAAEAEARARRSATVAHRVTARLARLERAAVDDAAGATGTITTRAVKSYGNGEPVTVSVIDHETCEARRDAAARLPPRARARMTRLASSNEARCAGDLGLIDGLEPADEDRLNALGIHRVEQLARLSDGEERALAQKIEGRPRESLEAWIGDARALLGDRSSV